MSLTKNQPGFDEMLNNAEATRQRWMDEQYQYYLLEQANAELPEPEQRFVLADGTVVE